MASHRHRQRRRLADDSLRRHSVVYASTSQWSGLGVTPPPADGTVFAYDPATGTKLWEVTPYPGLAAITELAISPAVLAESPAELMDRVRTRSISNLADLTDAVFQNGLRTLRRHAREGRIPQRIVEQLDLVVFRSAPPWAG